MFTLPGNYCRIDCSDKFNHVEDKKGKNIRNITGADGFRRENNGDCPPESGAVKITPSFIFFAGGQGF
jgi:hypothetical protein